jgi:23S rRNA G2069 N7-methylase RlmK/C1962 C5-methylase RlmI
MSRPPPGAVSAPAGNDGAAAEPGRSAKERLAKTGSARPAHNNGSCTGQMREGFSLSGAAAEQGRSVKERLSTTGGARPAHNNGPRTGQMREGFSLSGAAAEMLANRLRKRFRHLKKWARRTGTGVFRLYDRDIPEIPLVLDWYGDAVTGALYRRPYEKDDAEEYRWINLMKEATAEALEIDPGRVFIKFRERQRGAAQYQRAGNRGAFREVDEGGLRFRVNLSDYLDTGLFPDLRRLRALVREEAAGKRVLNLFCYTASFSVYAAAGGAAEIDSVDLSNTYLAWGRENFALNGFTGEPVSVETLLGTPAGPGKRRQELLLRGGSFRAAPAGNHLRGAPLPRFRFIRADVLSFLPAAAKARRFWDTIILDPPAFSNSKKMNATLDIQRDHGGLIRSALKLLAPGGKLWFSANARHFRLHREEFQTAEFSGLHIENMEAKIMDEDFRGKKIPACYLFQ